MMNPSNAAQHADRPPDPPAPSVNVRTAPRDAVELRLQRVLDALRWVSVGARTGAAISSLIVAGLALVLVDAFLPLPGVVRIVLGVLWLGALLRIPLGFIPERSARRAGLPRAARLLEDSLNIGNSAVVNALQLRPLASAEGIAGVLASRAVERGRETVAAAAGRPVVNAAPARRAWLRTLLLVVVTGALVALAPRVFAMVLPRYVDPLGDHPPYTLTRFDVSWTPDTPLAADDVTIEVRLSGPLPEALELVMLDEGLAPVDRTAMIAHVSAPAAAPASGPNPASASAPAPRADRYSVSLKDLREPVRFHVAGSTGRSRSFTIEPVMRPRITSASLVVTPPSYTGLLPRTIPGDRATHDAPAPAFVGSTIEMRLTATLDIAHLEREEGGGAGETTTSGNTAVRRLTAARAGTMQLSLRPSAASGLAAQEAFEAFINVQADAPPQLEVLQPGRPGEELFVLEGMGVPVRAQARDDVALAAFSASVSLTRAGTAEPQTTDVALLDPAAEPWGAHFGQHTIDTAALGARAGDTIDLTFFATDNRPDEFGGAQTATVGPIRLSILDRAEFARRFADSVTAQDVVAPYEQLVQQTEALEQAAQELAEKATELRRDFERAEARGQAPAPRLAEQARELSSEIQRFAAQRDALRDAIERRLNMPPAVAFDEEMREPLERLRERVDRLTAPQPLDTPAQAPSDTPPAAPPAEAPDRGEQPAESPDEPATRAEPSDDSGESPQPQSPPTAPTSPGAPQQPSPSPDSASEEPDDPAEEAPEEPSQDTPPPTGAQPSPATPPTPPPVDPARVGEWLRSTEEQLQQNAEEAGVAADEAALDMQRPAQALELADQLQRALEGLDDTAKQQRQLADRLASTEQLDPQALAEFAARQAKLLEQLDQSTADLTSLGNRAGFDVPGGVTPGQAGSAIAGERRAVQDALAKVRDATDALPLDPSSQAVRGMVSDALSIALTALYESTDPVLGALGAMNAAPRRIDDEGFEESLPALRGTFDGANQILDELQRRLDDAEGAVLGTLPESAAFAPWRDAPPRGAGAAVVAVSLVVGTVQPAAPLGLTPAQTEVMRELARARLKVDRLRATLRQAEQAYTPLLPRMGESALALAERAAAVEAAEHMIRAREALEAGDAALARSETLAAAEALESLYQEPPQGQPGQPPSSGEQDVDQPLELSKSQSSQSQSQQGEQQGDQPGSESDSQPGETQGGSSTGGGGKPSTLDQLRANRERADDQQGQGDPAEDPEGQEEAPGEQPGGEQPGQQPGDQRPGQAPAGQGQGQSSPDANSSAQQRARFFNERVYETDAQPTGETAIATSSEQDADSTERAGSVESPAAGSRSGLAAARAVGGADAETTFQHVPPGYRSLVGQYFLRIAQDQSSTGARPTPADAPRSNP